MPTSEGGPASPSQYFVRLRALNAPIKANIIAPSKGEHVMPARFKGSGDTLDLAIRDAHEKIPATPGMADELIVSRAVATGMRTGGIAGIIEYYAEVERAG